MSKVDLLKKAFRGHKEHCSKYSSGYKLECDLKSLAYSFIKDAVDGRDGAFAIQDIVTACEQVISEG